MAKVTPYVDLKEVNETINNLAKKLENPTPVFEKTLKDMYSRAPGKVADAVRNVYNIKKSDIMPQRKNSDLKPAGKIKAYGNELMSFELWYEGRMLTPLHFGMTPKAKPDKKKYKVKAKIKKEKATIFKPQNESGGVFLAPAAKGSSRILAWERYSEKSYDISPIKTMSIPQMVGPNPQTGEGGNSEVMENIDKSLSELLATRFHYQLKRYVDKLDK